MTTPPVTQAKLAPVEAFLAWLVPRASQHTLRAYRGDLIQFEGWLKAKGLALEKAGPGDIDAFLASLGLKKSSLARKLGAISSLYRWLKGRKLLTENPAREVGWFRLPLLRPPFLTLEEIVRLREGCDSPLVASILEFLLSTGIRESELCALDIRDLDMEKREAKVLGKGAKERIVLFSEQARHVLLAYLGAREDNAPALFVNTKGRRLTPNQVYYRIRRLGEKVLGRRIWPHLLRHTSATYMVDGGMTLPEAKDLLGHQSIQTTIRYAHPTRAQRDHYDRAIKSMETKNDAPNP